MLSRFSIYGRDHQYAFITCLAQMKKSFLSSLLLIIVISISFSLPIFLWIASINVRSITHNWPHSSQMSVFLESNLPKEKAKFLLEEIRQEQLVKFANYISPEQGLQILEEQTGMSDVSNLLLDNPLPAVIEIQPSSGGKDEIASLSKKLKKLKGISQIKLDLQWLMRLESMIELTESVIAVLMVLLCSAVLLVVGNTIRLAIINRKQEVEILKLIGATNAYIRRPFLYFGCIHGFLGALLALIGLTCLTMWLQINVTKIATLYFTHFELIGVSLRQGMLLLFIGSGLGFTGSYLSVCQQLRQNEDSLTHGF